MTVRIEIIPTCKIAYMRRIGPYGTDNVQTMERLKSWAREKGMFDDTSVILGVAQDDPETTPPDECRYDVCLVISETVTVNTGDVSLGSVSGGQYAVFEFSHTAEAVQEAWLEIFPELLRRGLQVDPTRTILERYDAAKLRHHLCEICVPVK